MLKGGYVMNATNTPKSIDDTVKSFCKSIVPNAIPVYVPLRPEPWGIANECYHNVAHKIKDSGGKRQLGWRIQVVPDPLPKFMIEAVHHAIWISDTGEQIDITPQSHSSNSIVFVPDDSVQLGELRIGEKYQALFNCSLVKEYVRLCNLESTKYVGRTKLDEQPNIPPRLLNKQCKLLDKIVQKHGRII